LLSRIQEIRNEIRIEKRWVKEKAEQKCCKTNQRQGNGKRRRKEREIRGLGLLGIR